MEKKDILRAKIDYHKTMMTISAATAITTTLGAWANYGRNDLAYTSLTISAVLLGASFLGFLSYYVKRHKQLIEELSK